MSIRLVEGWKSKRFLWITLCISVLYSAPVWAALLTHLSLRIRGPLVKWTAWNWIIPNLDKSRQYWKKRKKQNKWKTMYKNNTMIIAKSCKQTLIRSNADVLCLTKAWWIMENNNMWHQPTKKKRFHMKAKPLPAPSLFYPRTVGMATPLP